MKIPEQHRAEYEQLLKQIKEGKSETFNQIMDELLTKPDVINPKRKTKTKKK